MSIEVCAKQFKDYDLMLPEWEAFYYSNNARTIRGILLLNGVKDLEFHLSIVKVKLLVPTNLDSHLFSSILNVKALDHLTKGSLVYNSADKKPISKLFTYPCSIVTFSICNLR